MSEQEMATSLGELREICDRLWGRIVALERRLEALEGEDVKGIGFTVPDNVTTTPDPWPHTEPTQTLRDDWVIGALVDRIMREGIARDPDYTVPQVTMWDGWPGPPVETDHD